MDSALRVRFVSDQTRKWWALAVLLVANFMAIADVFITTVAVPAIQTSLGATFGEMQFVLAAYNLAYGIFLIAGGRLGDIYGRKRLFVSGLTLFILASLGAGMAPTPLLLILMRAASGLGAAIMIPQVISIIQVEFTGQARGRAFGLFAAVGGVAATTAQLIGGWLIDVNLFDLGWRNIFFINLPVGGVGLLAALSLLRESRSPTARQLDYGGLGLISLGILALTLPLVVGGELGWSWWLVAMIGAALPILAGFVWYERRVTARGAAPLVELSLFRAPTFALSMLMALAFYGGNAILFLILPFFVQTAYGFRATAAGLVFMPLALAFAVTSYLAGNAVARHSTRVLRGGVALLALGYALIMATLQLLGEQITGLEFVPALIIVGIGMGCINAPLNFLAVSEVTPEQVGSASGVLTTALELGYALGLVGGGLIFFGLLGDHHTTVSLAQYRLAFTAAMLFNLGLAGGMVMLVEALRRTVPSAANNTSTDARAAG